MKKFFLSALQLVLLPFVLVLFFAHYIGLLFAASVVAAVVAGWGFGVTAAFAYLTIAWKVYLGLGLFTFVFLTTFSFQHCCVGMQSFRSHLKHAGWVDVKANLVLSVVWPWGWYCLDHNLKGWGMSLMEAMLNAVEYWCVSRWRGITMVSYDIQTGKATTVRVTEKTIGDALKAHLKDQQDT